MPRHILPNSDPTRLSFMDTAITTAVSFREHGRQTRLDDALLDELIAHYDLYNEAYNTVYSTRGQRKNAVVESTAAMKELASYMSHVWSFVQHRVQRDQHKKHPARIYAYYQLVTNGTRPIMYSRQQQLMTAESMIRGDAGAVAAGYAPIHDPTIAEFKVVYDEARKRSIEVTSADGRYDEAQQALADLRPEADRLIKEVRALIIFSTRKMDAPSQRRVLRRYGARYAYRKNETRDEGDGE